MKKIFKQIKIISYFVIIFSLAITPLKVFAVDYGFYGANNIIFYDPGDTSCPETSTNTGTVPGSDNLETILKFLTGKGLSLAAASGIAGNISQESGYRPTKVETKKDETYHQPDATDSYILEVGRGFGIVQWTSDFRQAKLPDFAKKQNKSIIDLQLQLDYMWQELDTIDDYITVRDKLDTIKSSDLFGSTSAPMAAAIVFHGRTKLIANSPTTEITDVTNSRLGFEAGYEGSGDTTGVLINNRGKVAESVYNTYVGKIADGTGVVDSTGGVPNPPGTTSGCGSPSGDATWPDNVKPYGDGWTLIEGADYSTIPCASGTTDLGPIVHTTKGFTIERCDTDFGIVSSLISGKVVALIADAKQSGIVLTGGGYRTYEQQLAARTYVNPKGIPRCKYGDNSKASECTPPLAKAGTSEHERGLAIDIDAVGEIGSGPTWDWLVANGAKYGFYNLASEGWHWSMSGS